MSNGEQQFKRANIKPTQPVLAWKSNRVSSEPCSWKDIDPEVLGECVSAITTSGGAVMLGLTSDFGAFSICVLHGVQKLKEYPHGKIECEETLRSLTDYFGPNRP